MTITAYNGGIAQINADTGEFEGYLSAYPFEDGVSLQTSPDRKTLFVSTAQAYDLKKYDISSTSARTLQQQHFSGGNEGGLSISHNGRFIVMPSGGGNGEGYATFKIPTVNLSAVAGTFVTGAYPEAATWSNDDTLLYHAVGGYDGGVKAFNTTTFNVVKKFPITENPDGYGNVSDVVVDRSGQWLFIATDDFVSIGDVRIFSTGRSDTVKPRPTPTPITFTAQSLNISTRADIQRGNNALIGGFIISGTAPKNVILRAIGPSLPVEGALSDPTLELHLPDGSVVTNDNWKVNDSTKQSQEQAVRATNVPPPNDLESALVQTLDPGAYTVVVRGTNGATGIGLVEVYDLADPTESRLANISTRGYVGLDDNVMIGGFIAGPADTVRSRVVIRALGPSLPESGRLMDPVLELHNGEGAKIAVSDDYAQDPDSSAEVLRLQLAPKDPRESALFQVLGPGTYTAIVRGKNKTAGIGLVEVYNLK